jgi:hypothetical protein
MFKLKKSKNSLALRMSPDKKGSLINKVNNSMPNKISQQQNQVKS